MPESDVHRRLWGRAGLGRTSVIGQANMRTKRTSALAVALMAVCLPAAWAIGPPRPKAPRAAPRYARQQAFNNREQARAQARQGAHAQGRMQGDGQGYGVDRQPGFGQNAQRPVYEGAQGGNQRQPYNGARAVTPGHLQDWLNRHQNTPVEDQERLLRGDPSFNRQPPAEQQREIQQLHQLNQMPAPQRDRRLERNELMERLTPQQRMSLNRSGRAWNSLPPDRQALMKRAFQDLRNVPPDQRDTVLNSAHYQGAFSPEERGILSDFLRVEPYDPPR